MKPIPQISSVCFVGAGTMGCYNSLVAAISGYRVVLYDVDSNTLDSVPERHREYATWFVAGGYCTEEDIAPALARVSTSDNLTQATSGIDLVSESVFERLDIKRDIHRQLDQLCPPETIVTTNSSVLLVSDIETVIGHKERFAALHSHLGSPLVDIVGGPLTSRATIGTLERYVHSIGGVPLVLKKEHPGYALNAMLGPVLRAALALRIDGLATVEQVDSAWMHHRGAPMGPFGMMDLFGLNLIRDAWQDHDGDAGRAALQPRVLELLQPYIDNNQLGMKTGGGFYRYPDPAYQQPGFADETPGQDAAYAPLLTALLANAVLLAEQGVLPADDIDRAWMVGTQLDAGPFQLLGRIGRDRFSRLLHAEITAGRLEDDTGKRVEAWLAAHPQGRNGRPAIDTHDNT